MAKFNETVSPIGSQPFIAPGVSDQSASFLLKSLGGIAVDAYQGYKQAGLEKELEGIAAGHFTQNQDYERAVLETAAGDNAVHATFNGMPDSIEGVKALDTVNKKYEETLNTYGAALKQGRMSVDELYSRLISTTKQHVTSNPWMQDKLLKTADNFLEFSGLGGYIKEAQKVSQDRQDIIAKINEKDMMDASEKYGYDVLNDLSWKEKLYERRREADLFAHGQAQLAYIKDVLPEQAATFINNQGRAAYTAIWSHLGDVATTAFQEKDKNGIQVPYDVAIAKVRTQAELLKGNFMQAIKDANPRLLSDPTMKEWLSSQISAVDKVVEIASKKESKEDLAQYIERQRSMVKNQQDLAVMRQFNVSAGSLLKDLADTFGEAGKLRFYEKNSEAFEEGHKAASALLLGYIPKDSRVAGEAFGTLLEINGRSEGRKFSPEVVSTMAATLKNGKYPDEKTKIATYGETVFQMADHRSLEGIKTLPPESLKNMSDMVLEYYDSVGANAAKQIEDAGLKLQWEMVGGTPVLAYAPGSKKDDVKLTELNKIYSNHMRNSMQALSHLQGHTDYQRTFSEFVEGKTSPAATQGWKSSSNNPANLKGTDGNFREFATPEEGREAAENQLLRYMTVGSPIFRDGVPINTVEGIIANWRPASDRRGEKDISQEAYVNKVAAALGVGPRDKISPDQATISALYDAIVSVEQGGASGSVRASPLPTPPVVKEVPPEVPQKPSNSPAEPTAQPTPAPRKARGATATPQTPSKPLPLPEVKVTGAKDIYKPAPTLPADKAAQNKALMDGLKDKANIAKAELDVAGDNKIHPTLQGEIRARLGVIARAKAEGKEPPPYVSKDISRIKKGEKWYYHSSNNEGSFIYEPKNKVFLFLDKGDTATIEKRIGKKLLEMPKVGDIK